MILLALGILPCGIMTKPICLAAETITQERWERRDAMLYGLLFFPMLMAFAVWILRAAHAQEIFHLGRHDVIANCVSETGGDTICTDGFADRHDRCGEDGGQNERQRDALQNLRLAPF